MRYCLVIDDNDQCDVLEAMELKSKDRGFPIKFFFFNPTISECQTFNGKEHYLDLEKVENHLNELFSGQQLHIVATDYNLSDDKVTGLEVVRLIKEKWRRNLKVVLYSGLPDQIMERLSSEICQGDLKSRFKNLENFFSYKPDRIMDRGDDYEERVYEILKSNRIGMEDILEERLLEYENDLFNDFFPQFEGKKFSQIAKMIRTNSPESESFKLEFIERSVSRLIDLRRIDK